MPASAINVGKYANQRIGIDVEEEETVEEPGFELNAYPNPFSTSFTIAFVVPDENSDVRLQIIDDQGKVIKTVADNPHAKGKWQYEVKELPDYLNDILFCRLKINDHYTVKKLVHLTK